MLILTRRIREWFSVSPYDAAASLPVTELKWPINVGVLDIQGSVVRIAIIADERLRILRRELEGRGQQHVEQHSVATHIEAAMKCLADARNLALKGHKDECFHMLEAARHAIWAAQAANAVPRPEL